MANTALPTLEVQKIPNPGYFQIWVTRLLWTQGYFGLHTERPGKFLTW
jgi:hypothetical protein